VPVVLVIAVIAVLAGVFFAATGRGGEMAYEPADHAPLDLGPVSAADIALLRPPTALWGYNMQVTDEALDHIARAMRDRDVTIAHLQQQLANRGPYDTDAPQPLAVYGDPEVPRAYAGPGDTIAPQASPVDPVPADPDGPEPSRSAKANWTLVAARPHEATQPSEVNRASEPLPDSYDALGPQGPYDTHGWWAEQEEAAREEDARREVEADRARQTPPDGSAPATAGYPAGPAGQPGPPSGHDPTPPNPTTRPAGTAPDDDALAVAEEQAW
jgi:hypothetical protein